MPAFDPVRDAVLNSPVDERQGGNFNTYSPLASPSLGRRATDLSVLLNSTEPTPRAKQNPLSSSGGPSSLSNILSRNQSEDKLTASEPPIRRYDSASSRSKVPYPAPPSPSRSYGQYQQPGPPERVPTTSRPSSSSSTSTMTSKPGGARRPSSPLQATQGPPRIPYHPKKRITAPGSVLQPLSYQEMEEFKHYRGQGWQRLAGKRKRGREDRDDEMERPAKRPAGDVGVVVEHYNSRPDVGVVQRQESPIIGLKNFNNWVKSVLITRFAHPVLAKSSVRAMRGNSRGKVLDMGCGKGGDMTKWSKAQVQELFCVDIAEVSVEQARGRYQTMRHARFDAQFAALDCYIEPLVNAFSPHSLNTPFDVVSMQFCMHYAFETERKARCMLENVSRYLRPGGVFIGTIPNSELLYNHLDALPADAEELSFGNEVYRIKFDHRDSKPMFGHRYWFFLQDAVENVPEYVVHWDSFVMLAEEYGLYPTYKEEFHQVFAEHQDIPEFKSLMVRMKVVDNEGASSMDEDQWEAANIYVGFAFEKR